MNRLGYILIATIVVVTSMAIIINSSVTDPLTGLPAGLKGKVSFDAQGNLKISGSVKGEDLDYLQNRHSTDIWSHWGTNRKDSYPTASYIYYNETIKVANSANIDLSSFGHQLGTKFGQFIPGNNPMKLGFFPFFTGIGCPLAIGG